MFATVDNPSNAAEWALAEMMNKPDIMQKAVDELDAVVGKERLVQESDLCKLNYLKSCIREVFRLHPYHAFTVPRVAIEDTTIAGYMIPRGSQVMLSRMGLGRNSNVWDEPLEFRPERHLNGNSVALTEPAVHLLQHRKERLPSGVAWYFYHNDVVCEAIAGVHLGNASYSRQNQFTGIPH